MRNLWSLAIAIWMGTQVKAAQQAPLPPLPPEPVIQPSAPPPPREGDAFTARPSADVEILQIMPGYRTWFSFGQSTISMAGSGGYPNIISELKWRNLVNPIQEINVDTLWGSRFIARMDFGFGIAGTGHLSDQDFNDDNRTNLAGYTSHPANDNNVFYFNLDLGYRIWDVKSPTIKFTGDILVGYQFWQEKYIASDGVELFPDPGPFPAGRVVANTFRWNSFRIGARSEMEISRWSFGTKVMFVPVNNFRDDDIHYLRTDLLQDPSFIDQATGGFGVMVDATATWRVWKGLSLEAGYRLWYNQAGMGLDIARTTQGDVVSPLHQVQTLRQGILLGLQYRF